MTPLNHGFTKSAAIALLLVTLLNEMASSQVHLDLVRRIPMPEVSGRIDHMSADLNGNRLFVAALGNNSIEVVDLTAGKVVHSIGGLHEPQGVLYLPDPAVLWVANGEDGTCVLFDPHTFAPVKTVTLGDDADNVRYDRTRHVVCVGYGDGAIAVLDATGAQPVVKIPLRAHPESFQLTGESMFVNVPGAREIAVIDMKSRSVLTTITPSAHANFPMAIDEKTHRLYVGCRNPARLLVYDTDSLKELASITISGDVDDIFVGEKGLIYCSCGEGFLDVIGTDGSYARLEKIPTASGARTALLLTGTHRLYVAAPARNHHPAEILVYAVSS